MPRPQYATCVPSKCKTVEPLENLKESIKLEECASMPFLAQKHWKAVDAEVNHRMEVVKGEPSRSPKLLPD